MTAAAVRSNESTDAMGWHRRVGHPGAEAVKKLERDGVIQVRGRVPDKFDSSSCEKAKMTTTSGSGPLRKAEAFGDCVRSDIAGPFPEAKGGMKYIGIFCGRDNGHARRLCFGA